MVHLHYAHWELQCQTMRFTDVTGTYDCGAVSGQLWLQVEWPPSYKDVQTALKELSPL